MIKGALGILRDWKSILTITAGCLVMALAYNCFLIPNKIAPGGLSGIGTVLYHAYGFPVGLSMLIMNVPLFLLGIFYLGSRFGARTLFATILLSLAIDAGGFLPSLTDDPLLASLAGGAVMGLGLGLVLLKNATTGGTDLAARLLDKALPGISIGKILLFLDTLVVLYASVSFRNYELGLYAVVAIFVGARVIDAVVQGVDYAKAVFIISAYPNLIAQRLLSIPRGVTLLSGAGMFTGDRKDVLLCVVKGREIPRLKKIVKDTDPNAFVLVTDVTEVLGEGFKPH